MKRSDAFWISAFILGFLFAFGVFAVPIGLGLFLFMNGLLGALIYFAKRNEEEKAIQKTVESDLFVKIIAVFYVLLTLPYLYRLAPDITVFILLTQMGLLFFGAWYFALPSALHLVDIFMLIFSPIVAGITWVMESMKSLGELFKGNGNIIKLVFKVITYTALSLLVFIVFSKFLSDADPEFKKRIEYIIEMLHLGEIVGRTILGVLLTVAVAGVLSLIGYTNVLSIIGLNAERAKTRWQHVFETILSKRSDALLPIIVTVPVLLLFGLYVSLQFTYLFGQDISQVLERYTFAQYVHRGFAELLAVGILSYPLLSWSMNQAKNEWKLPRYLTFFINSGIVGLLVTMLYSLFVRMDIYTSTYGPSIMRLYVIIGAVFVGLALLVYEIAAVFRAITPGFRVFKGAFFGDYTIVALLTGLSLIATLGLIPWSRVTVSQLSDYYESTGKVDVFQLAMLDPEAKADILEFAQKLEVDGKEDGAIFLRANAAAARASYQDARKDSLFASMFGLNSAGIRLLRSMTDVEQKDFKTKYLSHFSNKIAETSNTYFLSLSMNDFNTARQLYDPTMKATDIQGFADPLSVTFEYVGANNVGTYQLESVLTASSKYLSVSSEYEIVRNDRAKAYPDVRYYSIDYGFRNGQLVITDSTLPLAYLPDAIMSVTEDSYSVTQYGYSAYPKPPMLQVLFSADAYVPGGFVQSDFIVGN